MKIHVNRGGIHTALGHKLRLFTLRKTHLMTVGVLFIHYCLMKTGKEMTLDSEMLRHAMRAWSAGVTVVTSYHQGQVYGMTVNSFTSISLEPPAVTISLRAGTRTHEWVTASKVFGLTILSADQAHISDIFAGRVPEARDRFAGLQLETLVTGSPLIQGGLAWFDCRVITSYAAGMNTLFIAEVLAVQKAGHGRPLLYSDQTYWQLAPLSKSGTKAV